jgi:hypothetical protein
MDAQEIHLRQYIERLEYACRAQMTRIDEQRAKIEELLCREQRLIDWIMGDTDALTCLQAIYNNPASSEGNKIKAAASALPFERPRLSMSISVQGPAVLGERLDQARAMKTVNPMPKLIEHQP